MSTKGEDVTFKLTFAQSGIEVTLTAKVIAQDFQLSPEHGSDNAEQLNILSGLAHLEVVQQASPLLMQFHRSVEQAFAHAFVSQIRSRGDLS